MNTEQETDIPAEGIERLLTAVILYDVKEYQSAKPDSPKRVQLMQHFRSTCYAEVLSVVGRDQVRFLKAIEDLDGNRI